MNTNKTGAAAIIWVEDETSGEKKILVGKESKYVSDIFANKNNFTDEDRELLNVMENLITDDINYVKQVYGEQADELETIIQEKNILRDTRIQYDTPEKTVIKTNEGDKPGYSIHYRYLPNNFKKGVIKGGYAEIDGKNEDGSNNTKETMLREIREEVGMKIKPNEVSSTNINCKGYDVYSIKIPHIHITTFEKAIESRKERRSGEVYDLEFAPLSTIRSELNNYNDKSRCAINNFFGILGGIKRKTNKQKANKHKTNRKTTNRKTTNRKTNKRR
jgi:hypothetical protein